MLRKHAVAVLLLALFAALAFTSALRKSITWDETVALGVGNYLLESRRWDIPAASTHPPLAYYLSGLPLVFFDLEDSCYEKGETSDVLAGVRRGRCLFRESSPSGDRLLNWARLSAIALGLLLGCFVYLWAGELFGSAGALLSLFLYCLSPNILAHTRLITPDMALVTFGFITAYFFWRSANHNSLRDAVLCGVALGLTLLTKFSGLVWIPVLTVLSIFAILFDVKKPFTPAAIGFRKGPAVNLGIIFASALLVLATGYGFHPSPYWDGIMAQQMIIGNSWPAYLNGSVSQGGWWYYYFEAFVLKVPLPFMVLLVASLAAWRKYSSTGWFSLLCLLMPAAVIFAVFSSMTRINIGLRYVLPAFPFLLILPGSLAGIGRRTGLRAAWLAVPFLLWYVLESAAIYPHYLAYFNQIAGGPGKGRHYLLDSNLDWGQDLKGLGNYMAQEGITMVRLSYFGSADPAMYGIRYEPLPSFLPLAPGMAAQPPRKGDILAISATNLYPIYTDLGRLGRHLRGREPIGHVGHSILLYRFEGYGE